MLQEAAKILGSAFGDSFIKKLSLYLHDCVREEVKSSTFRNLNQDKDNKWYFLNEKESMLTDPENPLKLDGTNSEITEIMLQAEISHKDRYLIYGYLFLKGRDPGKKRSEEYLTPLLYLPCKLERSGLNIECSLIDDILSLNTGALSSLMKYDDEDEVGHLFEGLVDTVPDLPLTTEKVQIFLTTLKSIIPKLEIEVLKPHTITDNTDITDNQEQSTPDQDLPDNHDEKSNPRTLKLLDYSAVILTKRPSITAGVLHELTQISEKPAGIFRETALNIIQEEYINNKKSKPQENPIDSENDDTQEQKDNCYITPLDLSDSQKKVIDAIKYAPMVSVFGPPGTGKTQTIINLVAHLVATGKTVLVASRMDKAVDVISERLNNLGAPYLCMRAGRPNYQKQLNFQLQDLLSDKVDLNAGFESSILTNVEDMSNLIKDTSGL